jgi:hypothetical protein
MASPSDNTAPENVVERKICPEVYSRIVGYLRPVQNWHQGKQQEFKDRKTFVVPADVVTEEE